MSQRLCPICGGPDIRPFFAEDAAVLECGDCGIVFDTRVGTDAAYYENQRTPHVDADKLRSRRRNVRQRAGLIRRLLTSDCRLLDIGCGEGLFLQEVRARVERVVGLEPTKFYAQYATQSLRLDVRQGTIETADFSPASFSVITMFHVLEHLESPAAALEILHTWLQPGGRLVLEVPNIKSPTARYRGMGWEMITPEHRFQFCPESLSRLLERQKYGVLKVASRDFDQYRVGIGKNLRKLLWPAGGMEQTRVRRPEADGRTPVPPAFPRPSRSAWRGVRKALQLPLTALLGWLVMKSGRSDYLFVVAQKRS